MEVDLQSLFGLYVTWCAQLYSLAETPQFPPPRTWTRITRALLVSQDRRHLFVTPWLVVIILIRYPMNQGSQHENIFSFMFSFPEVSFQWYFVLFKTYLYISYSDQTPNIKILEALFCLAEFENISPPPLLSPHQGHINKNPTNRYSMTLFIYINMGFWSLLDNRFCTMHFNVLFM